MGMRQRESKWISFILYILVAMSLFLTWRILAIPSHTVSLPTITPAAQNTSVSSAKNIEDMFIPSQLAVHTETNTYITQDPEIVSDVNQFLNDWKMEDISYQATYPVEEFNDLVLQTKRIEVKFPASVPLELLSRYFTVLSEDLYDETISRILISPEAEEKIYLVDDQTKRVYTAEYPEGSLQPLLALYSDKPEKFVPANAYAFTEGITFMPRNPIEIASYVYLAERQPNSFFINQLFEDTTELRDNSDEFVTSYSDNISELRINKDSGMLYYYRNNLDDTFVPPYRLIRNSFHEVKFLDTWTTPSVFSGYDSGSGQITYRRYVNGIPIYGSQGMGATRIKMANSGPVEIQFSTQAIQTPLEDREEKVALPAAQEVVERLESGGYVFADIQMMRVAYDWNDSEESSRVVELVPRWYVKMKGTWKTIDEWLKDSKEEVENGF